MQMQRSIQPFFRRETTLGSLNLDEPVTLVGDPDVDFCFTVHLGIVAVDTANLKNAAAGLRLGEILVT